MHTFKTILFDQQGPVTQITLNRPDAANGMNSQMAHELKCAARICDASAATKVVVLSASGRFFSAGGDIKEFAGLDGDIGSGVKSLADELHAAISTFNRMDAAFVVAVNGIAAGAGFSMAMSADLVLAAESASFTMAYTRAGLCPDGSASYFLPRLIGLRKTQELMLTNNTLSATQAADLGLITQVVADDELEAQTRQLAEQIASGSLGSIKAVKQLLLNSFNTSLETQMELEGRAVSQCAASADGREGITAFIEKRTPKFA